jgi:hypothetical protein
MTPTPFPEQNVVVAENQAEYVPLPAYHWPNDLEGKLTFCWQLSQEEIEQVRATGKLWHTVLTFNQPLQPILLSMEKPNFGATANE